MAVSGANCTVNDAELDNLDLAGQLACEAIGVH